MFSPSFSVLRAPPRDHLNGVGISHSAEILGIRLLGLSWADWPAPVPRRPVSTAAYRTVALPNSSGSMRHLL